MRQLEVIVTIPTYNEGENIKRLIEEVLSVNPCIGCLIVDDNSPDGTAELIEKLARKYKGRIFPIHRYEEKGRASAGIRGFKEALRLKPKFIAEMDADFSHRPEYLKKFLKVIKDCDVVLGSRFVKGGSDAGRSFLRKLTTFLSRFFLRLILGVRIKDVSSGFKLYKSEVIQALDLDNFFSKKGVAISLELNFRIVKKGYKIREVPIVFYERQKGKSKLSWRDFIEPVLVAQKLLFKFGRA